jgi:hypothetical protein
MNTRTIAAAALAAGMLLQAQGFAQDGNLRIARKLHRAFTRRLARRPAWLEPTTTMSPTR